MREESAIETTGLLKCYKDLRAVDEVDLQVKPGEIFGLLGPDGAGKTTIMRLLTGLVKADAGNAAVAGIDVLKNPAALKPLIGYMPQRFSLYGDLTVAENLTFFANLYHVSRAERLAREAELLEFSRLTPFRRRLAEHLSGGMKQKLALACTLIHTPKVLFLDEPTTGVDPVSRREFWKILYSLLAQGVTLFVSTPYMDEAERCHRVALMNQGKIILCDTPRALKGRMQGDLLELIVEPLRAAKELLNSLSVVRGVQVFGDRLHIWVKESAVDLPIINTEITNAGMKIRHIRQLEPGLEDVFMSLLAKGNRNDE